nr:hypothetical protein [Amylibacter sp.]
MDRKYLMMMGESKPNFALDLSNEGVALWHRASGGGWTVLGQVGLDAPDLPDQIRVLRDQVMNGATGTARSRRTVVRIPRSEVMLSKVSLGVFEDEAAERHGLKQIEKISPLPMEEVAYDLGEKGFGNMAPVGIVARQTLIEAEGFAKTHGFDTIYFTTQYSERDFPREPRFYLTDQAKSARPLWFAPWVAAASIGLAIGYFGYSQMSTGSNDYDTPPAVATLEQPVDLQTATAAIETAPAQQSSLQTSDVASVTEAVATETESAAALAEAEDETTATALSTDQAEAESAVQLAFQDIAPNLPPVLITLDAPQTTGYPDLATKAVLRNVASKSPTIIRLTTQESISPTVVDSSTLVKTSDLQIADARRDLPEVAVNDEIVAIIQNDMALEIQTPATNEDPIRLAALTLPDQGVFNPIVLGGLPDTDTDAAPLPATAQEPAERPAPPPSLVKAEPGTLTPTENGTLGPGNILIYSGKPPTPPRERPGSVIPADPLAGFSPRLRPDSLKVPTPVVEETAPAASELLGEVAPEAQNTPQTILDLADPAMRAFRAPARPESLDIPALDIAPEGPPTILAMADPELRPLRAKTRPATLAVPVAEAVVPPAATPIVSPATDEAAAGETTAAALAQTDADAPPAQPEAVETAGTTAPSTDEIAITEAASQAVDQVTAAIAQDEAAEAIQSASVLSLADPALRPLRAHERPTDLAPDLAVAAASETEETDDETDVALSTDTPTDAAASAALLALADPALAGVRAKNRPTSLRVLTPVEIDGLVALADPSLAGKKSHSRPSSLRVLAPEPEPEAEVLVASIEPQNTISSASAFAIAKSPSPKSRPSRLDRVVKRVSVEPSDTGGRTNSTASTPRAAVGTVKAPPEPTHTNVANAAAERSNFKKSRMSLVGVFGTPNARRALVRMSTGRYVKVKAGDSLGGWKVSAIGDDNLRIKKGSRDHVLKIP